MGDSNGTLNLSKENIEHLKSYEILKLREQEIKDELEKLKPKILEIIPVGNVLEGANGSFSVRERVSWEYSPVVEEMEIKLKEQKKEEQARGAAKKVETSTVYYTVKKIK